MHSVNCKFGGNRTSTRSVDQGVQGVEIYDTAVRVH